METLRRTVSDGAQSLYDVDFELGWFEQGHIYVYAGDDHSLYETQLTYVWQNSTQIELTVPEEYVAGTVINIRRIVPRGELYVEFKNSTGTTEKSLNQGNLQALMLLEEQDDGFKPEGFYEKQNLWFGNIYTCKELADGVDPQDAVTMKQVFDTDLGYFAPVIEEVTEQADRAENEADRAEAAAGTAVQSVVGTANQIAVDNADTNAPVLSLATVIVNKEDGLGNPSVDGHVLSSTIAGTRSWIEGGGGGGGGGIVPSEPTETTDFTAEIGKHYPVDTSGGDVVVTPEAMEAGDWFQLRDAGEFTDGIDVTTNGDMLDLTLDGVADGWVNPRGVVSNTGSIQYVGNIAGNTGVITQSIPTVVGNTYRLRTKARASKGTGGVIRDVSGVLEFTIPVTDTTFKEYVSVFTTVDSLDIGVYSNSDAIDDTNSIEVEYIHIEEVITDSGEQEPTWSNATACYVNALCYGDPEGMKFNNANGSFFLQWQDDILGFTIVDGIGESGGEPSDTGSITEIWSGSAGNGVTVDWSGTGYTLSQFDAIMFKATGGSAKAGAIYPAGTLIGQGTHLVGTLESGNRTMASSFTETSLTVSTVSTNYLYGIYGIRYGA